MRVGSIFKWSEFDKNADPKVSGRFFIYLGKNQSFLEPIDAYLVSPTARIEYYEIGGKYHNNRNIVWFKQGECKFSRKCVLDFNIYFYSDFKLNDFANKPVIDIIPDEKLRLIYDKIYNCKRIRDEIVNDVHSCFNGIGIKNLKKRSTN